MDRLLRPPFIDIGTVSHGDVNPQHLEDLLQDVCIAAVDTTRTFFEGESEKNAITLLEAESEGDDPQLFVVA